MSNLRIPVATYRLQFNKQFRFSDANRLVPYLSRLGISDLYASPILKARSGSLHGYDVTDPSQLNPELGTVEEFDTLCRTLQQHEMGLLLDIVPNHMSLSSENTWWTDFLENGYCSPYVTYFDIDWNPSNRQLRNKVLLPILDKPYKQALAEQEIILLLDEDSLSVCYKDYRLPLDVKSYRLVLGHGLDTMKAELGIDRLEYEQISQFLSVAERLAASTNLDTDRTAEQYEERKAIKESFKGILEMSPPVKNLLLRNIALFNGTKGNPESFELLDGLLNQQVYQLEFWQTARKFINYRRFFDIIDLIGVRVEELKVFEAIHAFILCLVWEGKVTGLRIDHIDGLHDPLQYLSRLQQYIASETDEESNIPNFYIVVEKILAEGELLPEEWLVFGTTGYDFMNTLNMLFVDSEGVLKLDEIYSQFIDSQLVFDDLVYEKKKLVINDLFPAEINALGEYLAYLARWHKHTYTLSLGELTLALTEITACLPVYRTYIRDFYVSPWDNDYLEHAIREARRRNPAIKTGALGYLKQVLSLGFPEGIISEQKNDWLRFTMRWQQLTSAIIAKGFEDTTLYCYNRLLSLNEVGGAPSSIGLTVDEFHKHNSARATRWRHTISTTSTHDTKRSEDVRARINVLSELADEWGEHINQWSSWNQSKKPKVNELPVPEPNMEVFLYQTLIGAWPLAKEDIPDFRERLKASMLKSAREAKVLTSWLSPNLEYEDAATEFIDSILEDTEQNRFLHDFLPFQRRVAYYGALNALLQVVLKITSPGVPDFYQGTELWDFSLVDPDNRRPVDFEKRAYYLDDIIKKEAQDNQSLIKQLLNSWEDGRVKLYMTYKALNLRKSLRDVFTYGQYIPLQVAGNEQEHCCAFARCKDETWAVVVVPRFITKLISADTLPLGLIVWQDEQLIFPKNAPRHWLNIFTGENLEVSEVRSELAISRILSAFPVALLEGI